MPEIKLDDEKVLRMFVDKLIADKGGDTLDAKQKGTLQKELFKKLNARMQAAMVRALPDVKLMELEGLLDAGAPDEEIESFFANSGVSFDAALRKTMSDFRDAYFSGKIKTSVKVKAKPGDKAKKAAPDGAQKPDTNAVQPAAGQPAQGVSSAMPGQSNVEGVANTVSAAAQGQTLTEQTQTVTQGAVSQPFQAQPGQPLPIQPLQQPVQAQAIQAQPVQSAPAQVAKAQSVQPTTQLQPEMPVVQPEAQSAQAQLVQAQPVQAQPAEQPLQAAPDLMDALNAATAHLNMTTANLSEQPVQQAQAQPVIQPQAQSVQLTQTQQPQAQSGQLVQQPQMQSEQPTQQAQAQSTPLTAQPEQLAPLTQPVQPMQANDQTQMNINNTNNGMTGEEA